MSVSVFGMMSDHAMQRMREREIDPKAVAASLKEIAPLSPAVVCRCKDTRHGVTFILAPPSEKGGFATVLTCYPERPAHTR